MASKKKTLTEEEIREDAVPEGAGTEVPETQETPEPEEPGQTPEPKKERPPKDYVQKALELVKKQREGDGSQELFVVGNTKRKEVHDGLWRQEVRRQEAPEEVTEVALPPPTSWPTTYRNRAGRHTASPADGGASPWHRLAGSTPAIAAKSLLGVNLQTLNKRMDTHGTNRTRMGRTLLLRPGLQLAQEHPH